MGIPLTPWQGRAIQVRLNCPFYGFVLALKTNRTDFDHKAAKPFPRLTTVFVDTHLLMLINQQKNN